MRSTAACALVLALLAGACAAPPGPSATGAPLATSGQPTVSQPTVSQASAPQASAATTVPATGATPATATRAGAAFDPSLADKLVPGQSTLTEATALLGTPSRIRGFGGGQTLARWSYTRLKESAALDIMFNKDGKMVSIVRRQ